MAYREAIALYEQIDDRLGQAYVLAGLGDLETTLDRDDKARAAYGEAIPMRQRSANTRLFIVEGEPQ